jgi:nitrate reductase (cytochrome), electron transfer subunit
MMLLRRAAPGIAAAAAGGLLLVGLDAAVVARLATAEPDARGEAAAPAPAPARGPDGMLHAAAPIAAEALVFRTRVGDLAVGDAAPRQAGAHPRTISGYRAIRAYPGAPPRVPHGLTTEEVMGGRCNTCHERGGYSPRFGAYVPVTPHPELHGCLQCHPTDAAIVGVPLPDARPDATCRQCHAPASRMAGEPGLDWRPAPWPELAGIRRDGTPPDIPHDLQLRGDCVACHAGPGAVAEIRTSHPERANCRQCHLLPHDLAVNGGAP